MFTHVGSRIDSALPYLGLLLLGGVGVLFLVFLLTPVGSLLTGDGLADEIADFLDHEGR